MLLPALAVVLATLVATVVTLQLSRQAAARVAQGASKASPRYGAGSNACSISRRAAVKKRRGPAPKAAWKARWNWE